MSQIKQQFLARLQKDIPALAPELMEPLISDNLLSPFVIELPSSALTQAQNFVETCFAIRENKTYQTLLRPALSAAEIQDPGNKSILMSYDFHLTPSGELKLIEINTNASFLALGNWLYLAHQLPQPIKSFSLNDIAANIKEELYLNGKTVTEPSFAIVDDTPKSQRLYAEFLLFDQLFKSWGWQGGIYDLSEIPKNVDFIYNRSTDFLFTDKQSAQLKSYFLTKQSCVSPNPFEYILLADKQRMIDLSNPAFVKQLSLEAPQINILKQSLGLSFELSSSTAERAWSERKKLFFKPMRSFGAKQSFKGASMSRKVFDDLCDGHTIAQEYHPAQERQFDTPEGKQNFKFDLRFYAYQNQIQSVVARLYQGQVTNLRTPMGGFSPVKFI